MERRRSAEAEARDRAVTGARERGGARLPVWRCRVCGYLAARERPPRECPVCKASQDRFEPFPWWV